MSKYLKNAGATLGVSRYLEKIQSVLVKNGAVGIQTMFDNGRISAISFALPSFSGEGTMAFQLPCNWRKTQEVLKQQGHPRHKDDDHCYRVAWATLNDWVQAQMALYETEMVTMPQIFLPFAITKNGQTLSEVIASDPSKLLGSGE